MSNGRTKRVNYKPRYTPMQAYDLLPSLIQKALQEGPQQWDTGTVLRYHRKLLKQHTERQAVGIVVRWLLDAHTREIEEGRPWREMEKGRHWRKAGPSPHVSAGASMQWSCSNNERMLNELCSS